MKTTSALILIAAVLSLGRLAHAGDPSAELSAADILNRAQAKYASLTSYSDDGTTVATLGTLTASSYTFTINLARTNLFVRAIASRRMTGNRRRETAAGARKTARMRI